MGRILCQLVLFEQQHQTPLLRNLSPFFWKSNILSLKRSSAKKHRGASQKSDYFNGMRYTSTATPPFNSLIILGTWILQIQGFLKMISSSEPKDWMCSPFASPGWCWSNFETASPGNNDLSTHYIWNYEYIMKSAIWWRRLFVWSIINCWNVNLRTIADQLPAWSAGWLRCIVCGAPGSPASTNSSQLFVFVLSFSLMCVFDRS